MRFEPSRPRSPAGGSSPTARTALPTRGYSGPHRARRFGGRRDPRDAPFLVVESGSPLGRVVPVGARTATIGRALGLALVLDDPAVSRVHAGLSFRDGCLCVQDFGSAGGTFLEGRRVAWATVDDGAAVRVGGTVLRAFRRPGTRARLERTRGDPWVVGLDRATGLPHGGALRGALVRACREARDRGEDVHLYLLDIPSPTRSVASRLCELLPRGAIAYRHGTRRLAVLTPFALPWLVRVVRAVLGGRAVGWGSGREARFDADGLTLLVAARCDAAPSVGRRARIRRTTRARRRCRPA